MSVLAAPALATRGSDAEDFAEVADIRALDLMPTPSDDEAHALRAQGAPSAASGPLSAALH